MRHVLLYLLHLMSWASTAILSMLQYPGCSWTYFLLSAWARAFACSDTNPYLTQPTTPLTLPELRSCDLLQGIDPPLPLVLGHTRCPAFRRGFDRLAALRVPVLGLCPNFLKGRRELGRELGNLRLQRERLGVMCGSELQEVRKKVGCLGCEYGITSDHTHSIPRKAKINISRTLRHVEPGDELRHGSKEVFFLINCAFTTRADFALEFALRSRRASVIGGTTVSVDASPCKCDTYFDDFDIAEGATV